VSFKPARAGTIDTHDGQWFAYDLCPLGRWSTEARVVRATETDLQRRLCPKRRAA
jgi:hypothetical protein